VTEYGGSTRKNEIGGYDVGGYRASTGQDPKLAIELRTAHALWLDVQAVREASASGGGRTAPALDFTSDRYQREEAALKRILASYNVQ
jgi:hypothetical protein